MRRWRSTGPSRTNPVGLAALLPQQSDDHSRQVQLWTSCLPPFLFLLLRQARYRFPRSRVGDSGSRWNGSFDGHRVARLLREILPAAEGLLALRRHFANGRAREQLLGVSRRPRPLRGFYLYLLHSRLQPRQSQRRRSRRNFRGTAVADREPHAVLGILKSREVAAALSDIVGKEDRETPSHTPSQRQGGVGRRGTVTFTGELPANHVLRQRQLKRRGDLPRRECFDTV